MTERIKYGCYWIVCRAAACCPFAVLYVLSDLIYALLYRVGRYRVRVVRENLRSAFPEKSDAERRAIERTFYHQLCDNIVESIKLLHVSDRQLDDRIRVEGGELVEQIAARNHPAILFTAHMGNWEWVPWIQRHYTRPAVSAEVYKPLRDAAFNRLMKRIRGRFGSLLIAQHDVYRELLRLREEEGTFIVGFVGDHRPNSQLNHPRVEFLNHLTPYDVGAEKVGSRMEAEYLYLDMEKCGRGRYRFTFRRVEPDPSEAKYPYTAAFYRLLEENIRRQPGLWLWSHRRWLYK